MRQAGDLERWSGLREWILRRWKEGVLRLRFTLKGGVYAGCILADASTGADKGRDGYTRCKVSQPSRRHSNRTMLEIWVKMGINKLHNNLT